LKNRILLALMVLAPLLGWAQEESLTGVGVQYRITPQRLTSPQVFWDSVEALMEEALSLGPVDLIIFPEYLGVLYPLSYYQPGWQGASTFEEAFTAMARKGGYRSIRDFYSRHSEVVIKDWEFFARFAREHNLTILAGSYFHYDPQRDRLTNRGVVFNSKGELSYSQDKVYLTPFETEVCQLDPGGLEKARFFDIKGRRGAFTICRDTFFEPWESIFAGGDLWIDIKANGELYQREQVELFARALPARIGPAGVDNGVTVCLTGYFLDLLWEGVSRLDQRGEPRPVIQAESASQEELLLFSF